MERPRNYAYMGSTTPSLEMNDLAPESVDLLQMVPENRRPPAPETPRSKTYESRRMRLYLVDDDETARAAAAQQQQLLQQQCPASSQPELDTYDVGAPTYACHRCPEGGVYYNRAPRDADAHSTHSLRCNNAAPDTDEGSVYFNYLQFANKGTVPRACTGNTTYEPITSATRDPTAHAQNYAVFNCCKSKSLPIKKVTNNGSNCAQSREEITYSVTGSSGAGILNNNRAKKQKDWTRIKRLMFLVGILLGIIVALGGIVVGFVVLAPFNKKELCKPGEVHCGSRGCVPLRLYCAGIIQGCPGVARDVCFINGSSLIAKDKQEEEGMVTLEPSIEHPVKDSSGWVYYSGGSPRGSKYVILNRASTFSGGQEECLKKGGYLAHVTTIREQVFMEDFLTLELQDKEISRETIGFWIGARRARGSHSGTCLYDQWKWVDAYNRPLASVRGFTAFVPGKPDNYYSPEECLFITISQEDDGAGYLKWDDAPCDIQSLGKIKVICEVEFR